LRKEISIYSISWGKIEVIAEQQYNKIHQLSREENLKFNARTAGKYRELL